MLQIRFEIAATDNTLLGCELDENHRPLIEQTDLGDDRSAKRNQDWPGRHGPECEFLKIHWNPLDVMASLSPSSRIGSLRANLLLDIGDPRRHAEFPAAHLGEH